MVNHIKLKRLLEELARKESVIKALVAMPREDRRELAGDDPFRWLILETLVENSHAPGSCEAVATVTKRVSDLKGRIVIGIKVALGAAAFVAFCIAAGITLYSAVTQ